MNQKRSFAIILAALIVLTVSVFPLGNYFSDPAHYTRTAASIGAKSENILKLAGSSAAVSALITLIPDDAGTPIAEKLTDFSEYFMLILCVLYAAKYLLTLLGFAAFRVAIPIACLLVIVGQFWNSREMTRLALKLTAFGLVIAFAVPLSILVADRVDQSYQTTLTATLDAGEAFLEANSEDDGAASEGSVWAKLSGAATDSAKKAAQITNRYLEALAVMIVTSCVIPMLVLLFFLWLVRLLTGMKLEIPPRDPDRGKVRS